MHIHLSEHFTYAKLLRFTFPTIVMLIFTSIYGVVDGVFVSNFAGKTAFAAVNLIMPALMIFGTVGFMLGTGGSAVVARTMGEGDLPRASRCFSLIIYTGLAAGLVLMVLAELIMEPLCVLLGAEGEMLAQAVLYGRILTLALVPFILQNMFQSFLVAAERPKLGLWLTVAAGLTNMIGDWLLVGVLPWGVAGAAIATVASSFVGGVVPLVYFLLPNKSPLHLTKTRLEGRVLAQTCTNGSSEMLSNLSTSLVSILYNFQLMRLIGEDGVAAFGVIMYVNFIFIGVFMGYSIGAGPIVSFHYGAGNQGELRSLLRKSLLLMLAGCAGLTAAAVALAGPLSRIFVGYDPELLALTTRGFRLYALSFLAMGFNIFGSAFFTALGNGVISAAIAFLRTLLFQTAAIFVLPLFLGLDGIWLSEAAAEVLALFITAAFLVTQRKRYGYGA
ncbi:MATE family efflux transporter [uncultured Oscillibacter sp.]|uniref:MATE family efflux transporter n=1 Tax=uncultured Oscillibacter sp. TaxID=876091 RepID=UPI00261C4FF8|nr:MATE family efflux transporter [uncultured Oscillibacter sp.]